MRIYALIKKPQEAIVKPACVALALSVIPLTSISAQLGKGGGGEPPMPCSSGCHEVTMEYFGATGGATEYDPYHARNNFLTPSPDGGVATQTQLPYRWRSYQFGSALCSPCPGSCLGSANIHFPPSEWFDGLRAFCDDGDGPP